MVTGTRYTPADARKQDFQRCARHTLTTARNTLSQSSPMDAFASTRPASEASVGRVQRTRHHEHDDDLPVSTCNASSHNPTAAANTSLYQHSTSTFTGNTWCFQGQSNRPPRFWWVWSAGTVPGQVDQPAITAAPTDTLSPGPRHPYRPLSTSITERSGTMSVSYTHLTLPTILLV